MNRDVTAKFSRLKRVIKQLGAGILHHRKPCGQRVDPSRPPGVVIAGYYGFGNVGDEAVLTAMLTDLQEVSPGVKFTVLSEEPAETVARYGVKALKWRDLASVLKCIEESDLLLVGGGGLFNCYLKYDTSLLLTPQSNSLFSVFTFSLPLFAHLLEKPCMIYGVGASRFLSEEAKYDARWAVELASACTVRDAGSKQILVELGCNGDRIEVTADPAFRLPNAPTPRIEEIRTHEQIPNSRPLIGVSLRNWDFYGSRERTEREVALALSRFIDSYKATVLFIPFDTNTSLGELGNDRTIIERVIEKINRSEHVVVLQANYTPGEISGLIAQCDIFLGMRLHSLILSIKNGVPCLGLLYDPKVKNMMAMAGLKQWVLDLDGLSAEDLTRMLQELHRNRRQIRKQLTVIIREMQRRALRNSQLAIECFRKEMASALTVADRVDYFRSFSLKQTQLLFDLDRCFQTLQAQAASWNQALRAFIDARQFGEGLQILEHLLRTSPEHAEWNYLKAFCLHYLRKDMALALQHYTVALENGFDEFWVCFNRGSLLQVTGSFDAARVDLERAVALRPAHEGARQVLQQILDGKRE